MKTPTNTTKQSQQDPLLTLAMMIGGRGIERQEAQGQRELTQSEVLPTDMRRGCREALERFGFKFGEAVPGDPMFTRVEMPAGWTKRATDHSMWSELVDPQGRVRGGIFYKAAFYDRSAHMDLDPRYSVRRDYDNTKAYVFRIMDGAAILHEMPPIAAVEGREGYKIEDAARKTATEWLREKYPNFEDVAAYWETA